MIGLIEAHVHERGIKSDEKQVMEWANKLSKLGNKTGMSLNMRGGTN